MFVEPGIQVKTVINTAPTQANMRHFQLSQEGDSDAQVDGRLFFGEATHRGQRQAEIFHCLVLLAPRGTAIGIHSLIQKVLFQVVGKTW